MEERNWSKVTSAEISLASGSLRRVCCDLGHGYDGECWVQWLAFHASSHTLPTSQARTRKAIPVNVNIKSPTTHVLSVLAINTAKGDHGRYLVPLSVERYLSSLQCRYLCGYICASPLATPRRVCILSSMWCARLQQSFSLECRRPSQAAQPNKRIVTSCNLYLDGLPTSS